MRSGIVIKLVDSFGSRWGRIRPDGETREVFFNPETLIDPSQYDQICLGQAVEFKEESDRANGTHAIRVRRMLAERLGAI